MRHQLIYFVTADMLAQSDTSVLLAIFVWYLLDFKFYFDQL